MKILVVSNMYPSASAPSYGVFVKNFCEQLTELNIAYDLAVMRKESSRLKKLLGYVIFYCKSFLRCLFGKYDIVYVHYASHSSAGVLLARKLRAFRIFTNCHGSDVIPENSKQEGMQKYTRSMLSYSERIIVPSAYFKRVVAQKYGTDPNKLYVCASGGVNTELFRPLPPSTNSDRPFTIGFVGRLSCGKGWNTLLQACAALPDKDYQLLIVGDGPEKEPMLQMIDTLHLGDQIQLQGLQPQSVLARIYNEIDVFAFPTERAGESLGLVAVEAMACGTPVIASNFAAPADYIIDGVNGYKFPKADAQALCQRLLQLRSLSEEDRNKLKTGALETAQKYTRSAVTQVLKTILTE